MATDYEGELPEPMSDELKPVGLLYAKDGFGRELRAYPASIMIEHGYTETPLYAPASLLAVIGKTLEAAAGLLAVKVIDPGGMEHIMPSRCLEESQAAILALDPATILASLEGLTA